MAAEQTIHFFRVQKLGDRILWEANEELNCMSINEVRSVTFVEDPNQRAGIKVVSASGQEWLSDYFETVDAARRAYKAMRSAIFSREDHATFSLENPTPHE